MTFQLATVLAITSLIAGCSSEPQDVEAEPGIAESLNRLQGPNFYAQGGAIRLVMPAYTAETGEAVGIQLNSTDNLRDADFFQAVSFADLWDFAEADKLRPIYSSSIETNIAPELRDPESRWVGLALHPRILVYNKKLVSSAELAGIENFASLRDQTWRGKLCLASSAVPANRLLVAFLIKHYGVREAEIIVRQWRANLVMPELSSDGELVGAISDGRCAIGIADASALNWVPSSPSLAAHFVSNGGEMLVDISGAGVLRHAPNADGAARLLEWLTMESPNALYAAEDMAAPANAESSLIATVARWPNILANPADLTELGFLLEDADLLVERAKYR